MAGREKSLGIDHPKTLATVHGMAGTYSNLGKYTKALEWYQQALAVREKSLGIGHPDTLATVQAMTVFQALGKTQESNSLQQQFNTIPANT